MRREFGLEQVVRDDASVVTVGTFDGVHRGHQAILRYLLKRAQEQGGRSVAVSFSPHPREVLRGEAVSLLTTLEERAALLEALGLDRFIVLPFTRDFAALSAADFVKEILVDRIGLHEVVMGYDHGFGSGREGNVQVMKELGQRYGFTVDVIPPQIVAEHVVSSTEIRMRLAEEGNVTMAAALLGRPYRLEGVVVRGDGRGRQIGFPTANLEVADPRKLLPLQGVYAVRVGIEAGPVRYGGMMNIGQRPTFNGSALRSEVHLFDFDKDLYGRTLRIEFVERMRAEQRFASVEALREQLFADQVRCRDALASLP